MLNKLLSRQLFRASCAALERDLGRGIGAVGRSTCVERLGQAPAPYAAGNVDSFGARRYADLPSHQELLMPALSPTMETGVIAKWLVKEGDSVAAGDIIADIETDKAVMGFEMQDEGFIAKLLRPEGAKDVRVGEPVCILVEDAADVAAFKDYGGGSASPAAQQTSADERKEPAPAEPDHPRDPRGDRIGPAVRKLLEENGLTAADVKPTGPRDIVTKGDVMAAIAAGVKRGGGQRAAPPQTPAAAPAAWKQPQKEARSPTPPAQQVDAPRPAAAQPSSGIISPRRARGETYVDIPHSQMRRIIAKRLLESKLTTPAIYVSQDAALGALVQLRAALKEAGVKLSVNDFVIKAAAMALRAVPTVNAGWDAQSGAAKPFDSVDVSVAVATPGGLITPIVTDADAKSLLEISSAVKDLAGRARDNKLKPHEFTGGSFTISNLGMYGISNFAAIINPPQACILAVGGTQQKTVMEEGRLVSHEHMNVTLSADLRVVDEESAAEFLRKFAHNIENPAMMMMA